jgi:hypothetical protein
MSKNGTPHGPDAIAPALCDEDEILNAISATSFGRAPAPASEFLKLSPVYFIGDSRAIVFRNSTYISPFTAKAYQLRSVFLRNLYAADFYAPERGLNLALLTTLATDQAAITYDEGATWTANRRDFEADADGHSIERGSAPLVLFCGNFDAIRVLDELGPDVDVAAWDDLSRGYELSRKPASSVLQPDFVLARMLDALEPFALGVNALQAMGFERIFVHGYPRPQSGERFGRLYGTLKSLRQYHPNAMPKVSLILDRALREIAQRTSARFVSGPAGPNGELSQEFTWDDVHYNARGASACAREVISVLEGVVE